MNLKTNMTESKIYRETLIFKLSETDFQVFLGLFRNRNTDKGEAGTASGLQDDGASSKPNTRMPYAFTVQQHTVLTYYVSLDPLPDLESVDLLLKNVLDNFKILCRRKNRLRKITREGLVRAAIMVLGIIKLIVRDLPPAQYQSMHDRLDFRGIADFVVKQVKTGLVCLALEQLDKSAITSPLNEVGAHRRKQPC